jgi:antirestriction protein ArdC
MTKKQKRDIRQETTDRIVQALEDGVVPWVKPWTGLPGDGVPRNAATKRAYRGVNVLLLDLTQMTRGYTSSEWLTYKQAQAIGANVRKGEAGTTVVFWKMLAKNDKDAKDKNVKKVKLIPMIRHFTVFNREQCDGMPALEVEAPRPEFARHEAVEALINATGADIRHGGSEAYYTPSGDRIQLPEREQFHNPESYYSTALHELVHWTGAPGRLDRIKGCRFGDAKYAFEELVAELGAAFLCAESEISGKLQHPQYIACWIRVLKHDNGALFTAASKARKAADLIDTPAEPETVSLAA